MITPSYKTIPVLALIAMLTAPPAGAQTVAPAAPSNPAQSNPTQSGPTQSSNETTVTVIAHRRYTLESAKSEISASDPHFSCIFNHDYSAKGYKRPLTPHQSQFEPLGPLQGFGPAAIASRAQQDSRAGGIAEDDFCNNQIRGDRGQQLLHDKTMSAAFKAYEAKDYAKALPLFEAAYDKLGIVTEDNPTNVQRVQGLPVLAVMAARMYLYGQGTPRDVAKAIAWLKKAALQTYDPQAVKDERATDPEFMSSQAEAAMTLANIYGSGLDVPVDEAQARRWYFRAAELDYYPAYQVCGLIFQSGYGGPADMAKAVDYFTKAAQAGYAPSQYSLGELYYTGDGVKPDKTLAGAWLLKAAKGGYPDALYAVGRMYDLGEGGTAVDPAKALVYYKEAAVKGQADAENAVGLSFYTGNGVPRDAKAARQWFAKASQQANVDAMFNLAVMLINGEGGDKDLVKAWVWLKIAAAGGHPKAGAAMAELEAKMTPEEKAKARALFQPATAGTN